MLIWINDHGNIIEGSHTLSISWLQLEESKRDTEVGVQCRSNRGFKGLRFSNSRINSDKKFPANVRIIFFNFSARQLEEKENEANEMYKKMTALHSQRNAQTSRMEEMEAEMAQVQLELSELQTQCEDKDAQVCQMSMNISSHFNCNQNLTYDLFGMSRC